METASEETQASTVTPVYGKMHGGFSEQMRAESSHPCTLV